MTAQTVADSEDNASGNAGLEAQENEHLHDVHEGSLAEQSGDWQQDLREAYRKVGDLLDFLGLDADMASPEALDASVDFPFLVTRSFAQRMKHGDANDPLLRQVLPLAAELELDQDFVDDPLEESAAQQCDGLMQKYQSRALVVATPACAIHCRYCFRRHFDYQAPAQQWWQTARAHLETAVHLEEVILSGGDPLILNNEMLAQIISDLEAMPHIQRLRIHSRLPIVLPARIDDALLFLLERSRLDVIMVIHSNHAQEIDQSVIAACHQLRHRGIMLLNQSVLLRGVNDSAASLADLSRALIHCGVTPYYLHAVDHVAGVQHFTVPDDEAQDIMRALQAQVSGYMLPRLVREIPGAASKTLLPF